MESDIGKNPIFLFRDFRLLFLGRLISAVGDKFFSMALAWWVLSTDNENGKLHMSLLMAMTIVPVVVFSPFIGTLVDRTNKRRCMLIADAARTILVLAMFGLLVSSRLTTPILYILVFLLGAFVPLFESSVGASLAPLTDENHLPAATALDANVVQLSNIFGALLGSLALAKFGVEGAFLINSASFTISFVCVFLIKNPLDVIQKSPPFWSEFRAGFSYLREHIEIFSLMLIFTLINLFFTPWVVLTPMIVKDMLLEDVTWVAILEFFAAVGSGIVVFRLSTGNFLDRSYVKLATAVFIMGGLLACCALPIGKGPLCLLFLGIGAMIALAVAIAIGLFQVAVPNEMKGRFFGILNTVCFAVIPASFIATGFLSEIFPLPQIIAFFGIATFLIGIPILLIPRIALPDR